MDNAQVARFTGLWAQAQPSVFAFISAGIPNFSDAEDVLQKTATAAVLKFEDFDESRSFVGWAIGIARYEVLRFMRDRSSDKHQFMAESLGDIALAFEELAPELDSRRQALSKCLGQLQGRSREVLDQRYGQSKKTGAIARTMGLTPGNVSVILNRTYKKLKECIDRQLSTEDLR